MNSVLFFLYLFTLLLIARSNGLFSVEFIVSLIFFIYGFSFYIDHHFSSLESITYGALGSLHYRDSNHTKILLSYTIFGLFYFLGVFARSNRRADRRSRGENIVRNTRLYRLLLLIMSFVFVYLLLQLQGMERLQKIEYLGSHKLLTSISAVGMLSTLFVGRDIIERNNGITWQELLFLISAFGYGLFEGGREVFVYSILLFLPEINKRRNKLVPFLFAGITVFIVSIWKSVSTYVFVLGDIELLLDFLVNNYRFSISYLDPAGSLLLLNSFMNGEELYETMRLSYIFNVFGQIGNIFGFIEYESISKRVVEYYSEDTYRKGGGFAFSGILESFLNFGCFGPLILGYSVGKLLRVRRFIFRNGALQRLYGLMFIIVSMKLVRTELAVVLKLYLLPLILLWVLFRMKLQRN